jgi:hypothetical protein
VPEGVIKNYLAELFDENHVIQRKLRYNKNTINQLRKTKMQYTLTTDSNGTSNLMHMLNERDQGYLRALRPSHIEKAFGLGNDIDIPEKGYTDPEWYFRSSDGTVWGIGWRWGQTRLRGRGPTSRGNFFYNAPDPDSASEFIQFISSRLKQ